MKTKSCKLAAFTGKLSIEYRWTCESFPKGLPLYLKECLAETAEERIMEMTSKGYREGELLDYVNTDFEGVETSENGFECRGWFTISRENA
jgi:hypothetical protein